MLILATRNQGKVRELAPTLARAGFDLRLPDADSPEVEETGATFRENALLKARALAEWSGLPALADDSGLEVDALAGAPGVYSARYGEDIPFLHAQESRDQRNIRKLLQALEAFPDPLSARFRCAMALVWPQGEAAHLCAEGSWEGHILRKPLGHNGFGYDPVFFDPKQNLTAAQLPPAVKTACSHRAKALDALLQALKVR